MKSLLWLIFAILIVASLILLAYLLRHRGESVSAPSFSVSDLTGVISLALNAALFVVTIMALWIAVAAYQESEKSGEQTLETLKQARQAMQTTADTLKTSAQDFRDSADASKGQYAFLLSEKENRDAAVFATISEELESNARTSVENQTYLSTELAELPQNRSVIGPMSTFQTAGWDLLRLYLPHQISGDAQILRRITDVYAQLIRMNGVLQSRENYRNANQAMDNFGTRMTSYDQELQQMNGRALAATRELLKLLDSAKNSGAANATSKKPPN